MILDNAAYNIEQYNKMGLHYDLLARAIYQERAKLSPFSSDYQRYIVAGLIGFDMGRIMGEGRHRYDPEQNSFAAWLQRELPRVEPYLRDLTCVGLDGIDLDRHGSSIQQVYNRLALTPLDKKEEGAKTFHVGTTKVLHWLVPELFIMVDQNVARAFHESHGVRYRQSTQPGYSAEKYIHCLGCAQKEIVTYGVDRFRSHEPGTPLARLFDKVAWVTGMKDRA